MIWVVFIISKKKYFSRGNSMFQYQCMFIGSILALLLTNISCNIKDDKNSKYSGFDPNLKRNKREIIDLNNTKISFQYEHSFWYL